MNQEQIPVSHADLYLKLGKLEGLMETMMTSVTVFQSTIKDVHARMDQLERMHAEIEKKQASSSSATSTISSLARDFAIPVFAIVVAWLVATQQADRHEAPAGQTEAGHGSSLVHPRR